MKMILSALVVMMMASLAVATPTTPVVSNGDNLNWVTLVNPAPGVMQIQQGYKESPFAQAYGKWNASQSDLGWDYLHTKIPTQLGLTNPMAGWYAIGYLEGYLTAQRISYLAPFTLMNNQDVVTWIEEHIAFMKAQSSASDADVFWRQMGYQLQQIQGITDGYNNATNSSVTFTEMFLQSFGDEIGDIYTAVKVQKGVYAPGTMLPKKREGSHCSSLIKFTEDDLFMAHDTWDVFEGTAHRIYKVYEVITAEPAPVKVTLSGYPATIASGDDWYMTSKQLTVQETTNEVFNVSLYTAVVPKTASEFMRVMAANYLADSGEQWTTIFSRHNSGTYNNQWMVVDMKRFAPGSSLVPGTFWIAEQIPGMIARGDMTDVLSKKGYWASYNVPYFWSIYDISGYAEMEKRQGSFWSYSKYARPEIFHRNNTDVHDLASMMRMMRYNNYKYDPFSIIPNCTQATNGKCDPEHSSMLSIASRGDLMKVYNTTAENVAHYGSLWSFVAQGCFGAIDSKIASYKNRHSLTGYVISGPTNDQQPTFKWGTGACNRPAPAGSPTEFDFPWVAFQP